MRLVHAEADSLASVLSIPKGVTAIVGGGGKTSLLERLAFHFAAEDSVIVTTTTHIFAPTNMPLLTDPAPDQVAEALMRDPGLPLCVGSPSPNGKLTACGIPIKVLSQLAAYVLIEADGAKNLPLKAPAAHEPVIPAETAFVIAVAGLDGIGKTIIETAFRPKLYAELLGVDMTHRITPKDAACVLVHPQGQRKDVLPHMRFAVVLNKSDDEQRVQTAEQIVSYIRSASAEMVVSTSLRKENA